MHSRGAVLMEDHSVSTPFDLDCFISQVKSRLPALDTGDRWIRSGNRIDAKYKELISSYRLLGSFSPQTGHARVEALLIKTQPHIGPDEAAEPALEFLKEYQAQNGVDAVFAALLPASGKPWRFWLTAEASRTGIALPYDLQAYIAASTLKKYIAKSCSLSSAALDGYFSTGYALYDDSVVRERAQQIDQALAAVEVCDISADTGALLAAIGEKTAELRGGLNKFIGGGADRTREKFLANFAANSLYATDLDAGALELLKLHMQRRFGSPATAGHVAYGSILSEELFNGKTFDIVLTNPPHIRQEDFSAIKNTFSCYRAFHKNADLYCYYIERALTLLKDGGCAGILSSNRWLRSGYGAPLRLLLSQYEVADIVDYGGVPAVAGMAMAMCALTVLNSPRGNGSIRVAVVGDRRFDNIAEVPENESAAFPAGALNEKPWIFGAAGGGIVDKIAAEGVPLKEYVHGAVYRGILTGLNGAFVIDARAAKDLIARDGRCGELLRPFATGRSVKRYTSPTIKKYLIFIPRGFTNAGRSTDDPWSWFAGNYPVVAEHLLKFKKEAASRRDKGDYWWELRSCAYCDVFEQGKIISPTIVRQISATMDNSGLFSNDRTAIIAVEDYYLLGLINSRLMDFYARHVTSGLLNGFYELKPGNLSALPVKAISKTNSRQVRLRDVIAENTKKLLLLNAEQEADAEQRTAAERVINRAVYKLYRLTPGEISVVENN